MGDTLGSHTLTDMTGQSGRTPRQIKVVDSPRGSRYILPLRNLSRTRVWYAFPGILGLAMTSGFAYFMVLGVGKGAAQWFIWISAGVSAMITLLVLTSRCVVSVSDGHLRVRDGSILIPRTFTRNLDDLRRFGIIDLANYGPNEDLGSQRTVSETRSAFARYRQRPALIDAVFGHQRRLEFGGGYPPYWLSWVCKDLVVRRDELKGEQGNGQSHSAVDIVDQWVRPVISTEQPADSRSHLDCRENSVRVLVPAPRFAGDIRSWTFLTLRWLMIMTGMVAWFGVIISFGRPPASFWVPILSLPAFYAVAMLIYTCRVLMLARAETHLEMGEGRLALTRSGPFGSQHWEIGASTVAYIRADTYLVRHGNQLLRELQVHTTDGRRFRLLRGQSRSELNWIAALLHEYVKPVTA